MKQMIEDMDLPPVAEDIIVLAANGSEVSEVERREVEDNLSMIPTGWQEPSSVSDINKLLSSIEESMDKIEDRIVPYFMSRMNEPVFELFFPFRTKVDRQIRESRFRDTKLAYKIAGREEELLLVLKGCADYSWDYISTVNLLNANLVFPQGWFKNIVDFNLFPASLETFVLRAKKLSDHIKTHATNLSDRFNYVELTCLTGYRNPPYPGFDYREETVRLAQGNVISHDKYGISFKDTAREQLFVIPAPVEPISFEDYVKSGKWTTAGSSSLGKVEWEYNGESGHFKARKNMLVYLYTPDELWDYVQTQKKQINKTLIKSELGKIRLAVSSDLATYLRMSWVDYYLNSCYLKWPGSTMQESLNDQSNRLFTMLKELINHWGLPFDYKEFDHQPTLDEILEIVECLFDMARLNVPNNLLPIYEEVCSDIREGFRTAVLENSMIDLKLHVIGGLMSGLRWTSTLGNAWNTVITAMVEKLLAKMGVKSPIKYKNIRGDDSAIVTESWSRATAMHWGYKALGVKAGEGKYSVWWQQMEFLRQWFDKRVHGYPARVLPGWLQRKPWNSESKTIFSSIERQASLRDMLIRRGCDSKGVRSLWKATRDNWCKHSGVSLRYLALPKHNGGLGLEEWHGHVPDSLPSFEPGVRVKVTVSRSAVDSKLAQWNDLVPGNSYEDAYQQTYSDFISTMSSDDVPGVGKQNRLMWREVLKKWKPKWKQLVMKSFRTDWDVGILDTLRPGMDVVRQAKENLNHWDYGAFKAEEGRWRVLNEIARFRDIAPLEYMSYAFRSRLSQLKKRGLSFKVGLDWLFGSLAIQTDANPIVKSLIDSYTISLIGNPLNRHWHASEFSLALYIYAQNVSLLVKSSEWYQVLFNW